MPSSLNMFIRVPKYVTQQYVFECICDMNICKVSAVVIKKGKAHNTATVFVDYWYKGTKHERDILIRGEVLYIPNNGSDWHAYEYKPIANEKHMVSHLYNSNVLPPYVTDNREERRRNVVSAENAAAAEEFIRLFESYATPTKNPPEPEQVVPGAPVKKGNVNTLYYDNYIDNNWTQIYEEEPGEIVSKVDDVSDITDADFATNDDTYDACDVDRPTAKPKTIEYTARVPTVKRRILLKPKK
jgi:hypothetical protein